MDNLLFVLFLVYRLSLYSNIILIKVLIPAINKPINKHLPNIINLE